MPASRRSFFSGRTPLLWRHVGGASLAALQASAPAKLYGSRVLAFVGIELGCVAGRFLDQALP
jgi:hypothetical protein